MANHLLLSRAFWCTKWDRIDISKEFNTLLVPDQSVVFPRFPCLLPMLVFATCFPCWGPVLEHVMWGTHCLEVVMRTVGFYSCLAKERSPFCSVTANSYENEVCFLQITYFSTYDLSSHFAHILSVLINLPLDDELPFPASSEPDVQWDYRGDFIPYSGVTIPIDLQCPPSSSHQIQA